MQVHILQSINRLVSAIPKFRLFKDAEILIPFSLHLFNGKREVLVGTKIMEGGGGGV